MATARYSTGQYRGARPTMVNPSPRITGTSDAPATTAPDTSSIARRILGPGSSRARGIHLIAPYSANGVASPHDIRMATGDRTIARTEVVFTKPPRRR